MKLFPYFCIMIKMRYCNILILLSVILLLDASCSSQKKLAKIDDTDIVILDNKSSDNRALYKEVESWLGTPYKYGGQSKNGTDCSGLVLEIYKSVYNKKLYRSSQEIYEKNCKPIQKHELKEGDLVFFITNKNSKRINHVGLYLKDDKFIHSTTKRGVIISSLLEDYYEKYYFASGRVIIY